MTGKWAVLAAAAALAAAAPAVTQWQIQPPVSAIRFSVSGGGQQAEGAFTRYVARIRFDPGNLGGSSAIVAIDLASVSTGQKAVDDTLRDEDWFDVAKTPQALFTATRFEKLKDGRYAAHGTLKMRGVAVPVTLPFTLAIDKGNATVAGRLMLDRTAWGIGVSDSMANDQVGKQVTVTINVKATAAGSVKSRP